MGELAPIFRANFLRIFGDLLYPFFELECLGYLPVDQFEVISEDSAIAFVGGHLEFHKLE